MLTVWIFWHTQESFWKKVLFKVPVLVLFTVACFQIIVFSNFLFLDTMTYVTYTDRVGACIKKLSIFDLVNQKSEPRKLNAKENG